jgi:hypothetical protein
MTEPAFASMGRIAPDIKAAEVYVPMPKASWKIKPRALDRGNQDSRRVEVEKQIRPDYGRTVHLDVDGSTVTLMMSEDTARQLAAALLAAADWDPEAALLRRADEILNPPQPEEPEGGER